MSEKLEEVLMFQRRPNLVRQSILVLVTALVLLGGTANAQSTTGSYGGRSLAEVLRELQDRGLEIFFTSKLVRPEMRVTEEPSSDDLRGILDEVLAPHRLAVVVGPGGRLVVVVADPHATGVRGLVRARPSGKPIPGARVLIPETAFATQSSTDGSFLLSDMVPGSYTVEARLPGFVVGRLEVEVLANQLTEVIFTLELALVALDEILVTPSRITMLREDPVSALDLDRDDIFSLPHYGDDIFRAITLLPGATGEESSARFNVRGGRSDEVLFLLDRVELFEPYHLKDFNSRVSIVAPRALREVNLITGSFPAQYGDRMSGVLDMSTAQSEERRTHLGASILNAEAGSSGAFREGRGHYLVSLRHSNLDLALELLDIKERPRYWDAFSKLEYQPSIGQLFGLHVLISDDSLNFFNLDPDAEEDFDTSYGNTYAWMSHQSILGQRLFVDSVISAGRVDRNRRGREVELELDAEGAGFFIFDDRSLDALGLKQDWSFQAGNDHYLKWGFDVRRLEANYDYFNRRVLDDPLAGIRTEPRTGTTEFKRLFRGDQYSVYLSDRWRPVDALTLELGLRYDEQKLTDDRHVSPRFNLVHALGQAANLRLAWGYFYQSQRPYELQVADGITDLAPAERTEQRLIGFERSFAPRKADGASMLLRVEAYQRKIVDPRPRYENLFQPGEIFPEIDPDRFLIRPESSQAHGLELFLRGSAGKLGWWIGYTYSKVEDRIAGRDVPRRFDQPHALKLDLNYRAGQHWNLNLAWQYHTGWPTTKLLGQVVESDDGDDGGEDGGEGEEGEEGGEDEEGETEIVPVLGPLNGERLPSYHRVDLRLSREWRKKKGSLGFFLEIQNVYGRKNIAGFDPDEFEFEVGSDGTIDLLAVEEKWDGFLPSFGLTWEF